MRGLGSLDLMYSILGMTAALRGDMTDEEWKIHQAQRRWRSLYSPQRAQWLEAQKVKQNRKERKSNQKQRVLARKQGKIK